MEAGLHNDNKSVPLGEYTVESKAANILFISVANLVFLSGNKIPCDYQDLHALLTCNFFHDTVCFKMTEAEYKP